MMRTGPDDMRFRGHAGSIGASATPGHWVVRRDWRMGMTRPGRGRRRDSVLRLPPA